MGDFGGTRSPERTRKRRRKDVGGGGTEPKRRAAAVAGVAAERMVGRYVMKEFSGSCVFLGKVVEFESGLYRVDYEDGDFEDLERSELGEVLIGEEYFDEELMRRRRKLDELVAKNGAKKTNVGKKGEGGSSLLASSNGVNAVTPMTGSVNGVEKIENEVKVEGVVHDGVDKAIVVDDDDVDSYSDSDEFFHGCDAWLECETPVGVPPDLPPSSGNIGVPKEYVPNLFSVYGFLRSFGACLFLSPFTMDELVGCVNCIVPNSLLDAIHVALLRAIRRHLEAESSDGSELASKCLRAIDWELLDMLTWPIYLVHYLMAMGYFDGNEWKGVSIHILEKHYCTLSAGRKLMVLQILCDNALESEEIRAEMDMPEEAEVGIDAEEFESVFPESSPKRVHPRYSKTFAGNTSAAMDVSVRSNGKTPTNSSSMGLKGSGLRNNLATGEDGNSDDCCLCGMDGTLLCCDGCPSAYHSRCIGVSKAHIPDGPWFCPECSIRKTEPTIAVGTSLRGAELFGIDPYEQVFLGTCNHLLVLKVSVDISPFVRYYSCDDIPVVLSALHSSENHSVLYSKICQAILMYWNMPQTVLPHQTVKKTMDLSTMEEVASTTVCVENTAQKAFGKAVTKKFSNSNVDSIGGLPIVNFTGKTGLDEIPLGVGSALTEPATSSSLHHDFSAVGPADGANFPVNGTINGRDGGKGVGNGEHGLGKSRSYLGSSFKTNIYINHYVHGEFAASAAANLAVLSSEENRVSAAQASDNPKKALLASVALQTKAFASAAVRFFWPNPEKFIEVPRERCSWCLNCQFTTKKACLLNAAALNATRGATKIISKLSLTKNVETGLYGIAMYVLYMEEALHGLVAGPFLDASHRQQWRKQVAQIANCYEIKSLLLELEEHVRAVAFSGEWIKQVDNLMSDSSVTQTTCPTGSTQKRGPGRRRKHIIPAEVPADNTDEKMADFTWWRGGKLSKLLSQKGMLPHALLLKAARQGGSARVRGVYYAEGSDVLKRSRQFIWRVAVEMSKNVSQLALQIRYLDHHVRWCDLTRPEQIQDPKGPETEASAFRNARISDKKHVDDKLLYGVKFGHQRHLPSRLMKSIIEKEESNGTENYWFLEARVPLYLIREYEESTLSSVVPPVKRELGTLSKLQKRQLKASRKDLFTYLVRKRDNLTTCYCASCNRDVFLSNAVKCNGCEGYCHRECASSSIIQISDDVEFFITCKRCYGGSAFAQNQSFAESPTSPLAIQGQGYQKALTVSKSSIQKNSHQQPLAIATVEGSSGLKLKIKLAAPDSSVTKKSKKKPAWGLIWKKKNIEETGTKFRSNHILWRANLNNVAIAPVCYLCQKPYNPHLLYIRCPACQEWFHADALELDESKIVHLVGFKCSRCRRIKTPTCPYDDKSVKKVEIKKLRIKSSNSEKVESGSLSRAISERTESIPSTPITPMDDDVLIQLDGPTVIVASNVEPISEQKTEVDLEWDVASVDDPLETEADFEWDAPSADIPQKTEIDYEWDAQSAGIPQKTELDYEWDAQATDSPQKADVDYEWDAPSIVGPRKLPVRRCVKPEQDDGFPGFTSQLDLSVSNDHVSSGDNISSHHLSWDVSSTGLENGTVFDYENLNNEDADFEPQTYFSMGELLDSNDVAQSGVDELANVQNQWEDWTYTNSHDVSQDQYDVGTLQQTEPGTSNDDCMEPVAFEQDVPCGRCSQTVPVPDLSCQNCGLNIHSHCSPWEDFPQEESWKCGNCRAWR